MNSLILTDNGLTGNIPSELASLSNLEQLILSGNQVTGNIPSELASLSNLLWLDLNSNSLSGNIPAELGNMSKLEHNNGQSKLRTIYRVFISQMNDPSWLNTDN